MNLLTELAKAGFIWTLVPSSAPSSPGSKHQVSTLLLTLIPEPGAAPVQHHYRSDTLLSLEHMVSLQFRKHMPDHPVYREWVLSKGNTPVKLAPGVDLEGIGEPMHTGLRKLADSDQSVITWNALHHLHSADRAAIWTAAGGLLRKAFSKPDAAPLRRALARQLKDVVIEALDNAPQTEELDGRQREIRRTDTQTFALRAMTAACKLTDIDEWMWGWLGYAVQELPEEPVIAAAPAMKKNARVAAK